MAATALRAVCIGCCSHWFWINTGLLLLPSLTRLSPSACRQTEVLCSTLGAATAQGIQCGFWMLSGQLCVLCGGGAYVLQINLVLVVPVLLLNDLLLAL